MGTLVFTLGSRKGDPELEVNAENIYNAAIEYGCDHQTAARLVQAILQAEEETIIEKGERDAELSKRKPA